jgi:hypothetical protein
MAVKNLESLVLRGSAVLLVGKAGNPRLGTDSAAKRETPEVCISLRHPSHRWGQAFQPASRPGHADYCRVDSLAAYGAGRLLSSAGVLSQSCLRSAGDNARTRGLTTVTTVAIPAVMRCPVGRVWRGPAGRTFLALS